MVRLDFRKFACKIGASVCGSGASKVIGCLANAPGAHGLWPAQAATWKRFLPGVALTKKILDPGLGKFNFTCRIAEYACRAALCCSGLEGGS